MIGDGIKTAETKSGKFEMRIRDGIRRFLDAQDEPMRSLKVEKYDGTDSKYHSDIRVTNP